MSHFRLVLVPAVVTLAVTLLRLTGELNEWSRAFFNPDAGGRFAVVGIAWLVPIFGVYFARKLYPLGGTASGWTTVGCAALAIVAFFVVIYSLAAILSVDFNRPTLAALGANVAASLVALSLAYWGSGALGRALLSYGVLARLPVLLVMLLAILGDWGTHYDVLPPGVEVQMSPWAKWFFIGVVPQLGFWMAFTVAVGALFGGAALILEERKRPAARPAQ